MKFLRSMNHLKSFMQVSYTIRRSRIIDVGVGIGWETIARGEFTRL